MFSPPITTLLSIADICWHSGKKVNAWVWRNLFTQMSSTPHLLCSSSFNYWPLLCFSVKYSLRKRLRILRNCSPQGVFTLLHVCLVSLLISVKSSFIFCNIRQDICTCVTVYFNISSNEVGSEMRLSSGKRCNFLYG